MTPSSKHELIQAIREAPQKSSKGTQQREFTLTPFEVETLLSLPCSPLSRADSPKHFGVRKRLNPLISVRHAIHYGLR